MSEQNTQPVTASAVASSDLVRMLWPGAPRIGSADRIWCGVKKHQDGRWVCCVVGGPDDRYRKCRIIGYQIEMGEACGVRPRDRHTITLLVKVRMNGAHPLIEREHLSHVDCLESYAKHPNDAAQARRPQCFRHATETRRRRCLEQPGSAGLECAGAIPHRSGPTSRGQLDANALSNTGRDRMKQSRRRAAPARCGHPTNSHQRAASRVDDSEDSDRDTWQRKEARSRRESPD
jgi:hypothetical protein